jgi:hypothetical protein
MVDISECDMSAVAEMGIEMVIAWSRREGATLL